MKILALSDQAVERVYTLGADGHFRNVQLIVGCGDLPYSYLEYLVSMLNVPMFYVPGNHDPRYDPRSPLTCAEGGVNLDLRRARLGSLLIAGFGGSARYRPGAVNQYSQAQAFGRALHLLPGLLWNRARYGRALDILISHSPPYGIHDDESEAHRGLKAIRWLLHWARPRYHLHGHTHFFRQNLSPSVTRLGHTTIINVFPYRIIEVDDAG